MDHKPAQTETPACDPSRPSLLHRRPGGPASPPGLENRWYQPVHGL